MILVSQGLWELNEITPVKSLARCPEHGKHSNNSSIHSIYRWEYKVLSFNTEGRKFCLVLTPMHPALYTHLLSSVLSLQIHLTCTDSYQSEINIPINIILIKTIPLTLLFPNVSEHQEMKYNVSILISRGDTIDEETLKQNKTCGTSGEVVEVLF